eukprot:CAMPEP_0203971124 /NCGR_PEP_ID=MMETSP0359-20131031/98317_1 /ASSEMBLY_ACC=CAM_ASM_000338 /TAXON_ID=268821 /ORGANISM="Scrippsiella Hangoei, Strain SHTV-5" /LENGTH=211 /DNA_ID=CAMNT_0050909091 /DNA_START=80 /DNA_END=715 /DNA_ORIENTATION=+
MAFTTTTVTRSRSGFLKGAVLAAIGMGMTSMWSSLGFTIVRPQVLDRQEASSPEEIDGPDAVERKGPRSTQKLQGDAKYTTSTFYGRNSQAPGVAQGPPWSTCFVEFVADGRPGLEEWVMRGDMDNTDNFKAWRKHGMSGDSSVRCTPATNDVTEETMCLQCVSHAPESLGSSVATLQAHVVSTFTTVEQCLAGTVGGKNFCKNGQVVLPF